MVIDSDLDSDVLGQLEQCNEYERFHVVSDWLNQISNRTHHANKIDNEQLSSLTNQILSVIRHLATPCQLIARQFGKCLRDVFAVSEPYILFDTVALYLDIIQSRSEVNSLKITLIVILGEIYQVLGKSLGRLFKHTVITLVKAFKCQEIGLKLVVLHSLCQVAQGVGFPILGLQRDLYKFTRSLLSDRELRLRASACTLLDCIFTLGDQIACKSQLKSGACRHFTACASSSDCDNFCSLCVRAFVMADLATLKSVSALLATFLFHVLRFHGTQTSHCVSQQQQQQAIISASSKNHKDNQSLSSSFTLPAHSVFTILKNAYFRGPATFMKGTGEIMRGSAQFSRCDVRLGVVHVYIDLLRKLGSSWLEQNMKFVVDNLLDLLRNPKVFSTYLDVIGVRKHIVHILNSTLASQFDDRQLLNYVLHLLKWTKTRLVDDVTHSPASAIESSSLGSGASFYESCRCQDLTCILLHISTLLHNMGEYAAKTITNTHYDFDILSVLLSACFHLESCVRFAAVWCIRNLCLALPIYIHTVLDTCLSYLTRVPSSIETVFGCSLVVSVLFGISNTTSQCFTLSNIYSSRILSIAEDLLKPIMCDTRTFLVRSQSAWLMIGSFFKMSPSVIKDLLPDIRVLWRRALVHSKQKLDAETAQSYDYSCYISIEYKAMALGSIFSFLRRFSQSDRQVEDRVACGAHFSPLDEHRCVLAVESIVFFITNNMTDMIKDHGDYLKPSATLLKLRLFQVSALCSCNSLQATLTSLMRLVVAEITLCTTAACVSSSYLHSSSCVGDQLDILGTRSSEPNLYTLQQQLIHNSTCILLGFGAIENDLLYLYESCDYWWNTPDRLPLNVSLLDETINLFSHLFISLSNKNVHQLLSHLLECFKQLKGARYIAVLINVISALLCTLRRMSTQGHTIDDAEVYAVFCHLVETGLAVSNAVIRRASAECYARLAAAHVDTKSKLLAVSLCVDKLTVSRDVYTRTGYALTLGYLYRFCYDIGCQPSLSSSIDLLLALTQDTGSYVVQTWSSHALTLVLSAHGCIASLSRSRQLAQLVSQCSHLMLTCTPPGTCRDSVTESATTSSCLSTTTRHLLTASLIRLVAAFISNLGPQLNDNVSPYSEIRSHLTSACSVLLHDTVTHTQSETVCATIQCLQEMCLFVPDVFQLDLLIMRLFKWLNSDSLFVCRNAFAFLLQLSQQHYSYILKIWFTLAYSESDLFRFMFNSYSLYCHDTAIARSVINIIQCFLQETVCPRLDEWICVLVEILTSSSTQVPFDDEDSDERRSEHHSGCYDNDFDDQQKTFKVSFRYKTKLFAVDILLRIFQLLDSNEDDRLVKHVSSLLRISYILASSECSSLIYSSLQILDSTIQKFGFTRTMPSMSEAEFYMQQFDVHVTSVLGAIFEACFVLAPSVSRIDGIFCDVKTKYTDSWINICSTTDIRCRFTQLCSLWLHCDVISDIYCLRRVFDLMCDQFERLFTHELAVSPDESYCGRDTDTSVDRSLVHIAFTYDGWEKVCVLCTMAQLYTYLLWKDGLETLFARFNTYIACLSRLWILVIRDFCLITLHSTDKLENLQTYFCYELSIDCIQYLRIFSSFIIEALCYCYFFEKNKPFMNENDNLIDHISYLYSETCVLRRGILNAKLVDIINNQTYPILKCLIQTLSDCHFSLNQFFILLFGTCIHSLCEIYSDGFADPQSGHIETCLRCLNALALILVTRMRTQSHNCHHSQSPCCCHDDTQVFSCDNEPVHGCLEDSHLLYDLVCASHRLVSVALRRSLLDVVHSLLVVFCVYADYACSNMLVFAANESDFSNLEKLCNKNGDDMEIAIKQDVDVISKQDNDVGATSNQDEDNLDVVDKQDEDNLSVANIQDEDNISVAISQDEDNVSVVISQDEDNISVANIQDEDNAGDAEKCNSLKLISQNSLILRLCLRLLVQLGFIDNSDVIRDANLIEDELVTMETNRRGVIVSRILVLLGKLFSRSHRLATTDLFLFVFGVVSQILLNYNIDSSTNYFCCPSVVVDEIFHLLRVLLSYRFSNQELTAINIPVLIASFLQKLFENRSYYDKMFLVKLISIFIINSSPIYISNESILSQCVLCLKESLSNVSTTHQADVYVTINDIFSHADIALVSYFIRHLATHIFRGVQTSHARDSTELLPSHCSQSIDLFSLRVTCLQTILSRCSSSHRRNILHCYFRLFIERLECLQSIHSDVQDTSATSVRHLVKTCLDKIAHFSILYSEECKQLLGESSDLGAKLSALILWARKCTAAPQTQLARDNCTHVPHSIHLSTDFSNYV